MDHFKFTALDCSPENMPVFDSIKMTIFDENQNLVNDSIIELIEKRRTVFKPCREIIYQANFKSENGKLISKTRIKLMATGKRWNAQPELQDEIVIQYEYTSKDFKRCREYQLNKKLLDHGWSVETITGVRENVKEVWMHPFRENQFNFTEVAPFPKILFPLDIGRSWEDTIRIPSGNWGDWENSEIISHYEVTNKETIKTRYGQIDDCWKIESRSDFRLGKSEFYFWFHEELGFIRMEYKNYENQTLLIELEEVNENDT